MRTITKIIFSFLLLAGPLRTSAVEAVRDRIEADTTVRQEDLRRTSEFYERLRARCDNSGFARMLYRVLVSSKNRQAEANPAAARLIRDTEYFLPYQGREIDNVLIFRNNVYEGVVNKRSLKYWANSLHVVTRESTVRRNLLFGPGDRIDADVMARNEQILRSMDFLSDAYIVVAENPEQEGVNIYVFTRDSWTITPELKSSKLSHYYFSLVDDNILGSGNSFTLRTYYSWKYAFLGGEVGQLHMPNVLGSFFTLDLIAGKGFDEYFYGAKTAKEFILPSDYMAGAKFEFFKEYQEQVMTDTVLLVKHRNIDVWSGKSWSLSSNRNSFFITTGFQDRKFFTRPEVAVDTNTYYHSYRGYLTGVGIYRESYYRGNMIYSFGATEDIPYGHKIELIGGYYDGEFGNKWYGGVNLAIGRQTNFGYFRAQAFYSSFLNSDKNHMQRTLELGINGFSNIMRAGRSYFRQFFNVDYVHGFNRLYGEGETLIFRKEDSPRGFRYNNQYGKVRLVLNTETVLFTPIYFYGFRFAFFSFVDLGWLGNNHFVYGNDFFSALGLGLRLKNERLVFSTIQIRLGIGVGSHGFEGNYRHFKFSHQQRLRMPGFKPEAPALYDYR